MNFNFICLDSCVTIQGIFHSIMQGCKNHGTVAPMVLRKVTKLKEDRENILIKT